MAKRLIDARQFDTIYRAQAWMDIYKHRFKKYNLEVVLEPAKDLFNETGFVVKLFKEDKL